MSDDGRDRSRDRERTKRERPTRFSDQSRDRSLDRGKERGGLKSSLCRVYVSNIPYEYRWQDLKDLFRSQVGDVSFVELFVDAQDKPRGCGIVEFSDSNSVKKCLEVMHRFELKGRKLVIKEDFGNSRDKYGNLVGSSASKRARDREDTRDRYRDDHHRGGGGGGGGGGYDNQNSRSMDDNKNWGNTYGLSPQFLESLGVNVPLMNRIFIANLDYKVDKKKLKEVFRLAGKVQRIELSSDREGKSRGFAVLEYDHPVEAVQAISMLHNQILYDRAMTVRMDREGDRGISKLPEGLKGLGMGLGSNGEPLKDVSRNLPSLSSVAVSQTPQSNAGAGILGAVPNMSLGISNALSGLNSVNTSALSNAAVLQAANLAGVGGLPGNLLANSLGGGDLSLAAASLVNNPLIQNQSLLANSGGLSNNNLNNSNFSRNDGGYGGGNNSGGGGGNQNNSGYQNPVMSQNQGYLSGKGGFGGGGGGNNYDDQKNSGGFGYTTDRDTRSNNSSNIYSTVNNGSQMLRSSNLSGNLSVNKGNNGYSNKILITNLPQTASLKMLTEKCNEFGDVQRIEDKGNNGLLVVFSSEWEAERAIKNMDRARIDGRTIDVRFFY